MMSDILFNLGAGYPGEKELQFTRKIIQDSTTSVLQDSANSWNIFNYGSELGDSKFREEVSSFVNKSFYCRSKCTSNDIVLTAGASQGLYFLTTYLSLSSDPVFVEDPSYFVAIGVFKKDLQKKIVIVPILDGGLDVGHLDKLLLEHSNNKRDDATRPGQFNYLIYTMPTFHNPLGTSLSAECSKSLVKIARKHNALIVCDDVYNLLSYTDEKNRPKALIEFDDPNDSDYTGGNVVSNCSFSKILGPGLRVGWMEAGPRIVSLLTESNSLFSGGAVNHYTSMLLTNAMSSGAVTQHLKFLRSEYGERMSTVCQILRDKLPVSVKFVEPKGGYFIWIELPYECSSYDLLELAKKKYQLKFIPGPRCSAVEGFKNCLRISISYYAVEQLVIAVSRLCEAIKEYLQTQER